MQSKIIFVEGLTCAAVANAVAEYLKSNNRQAICLDANALDLTETQSSENTSGQCALDFWKNFANNAEKGVVYVLDGCLLRNPLATDCLATDEGRYVKEIAKVLKPFDPFVLYCDDSADLQEGQSKERKVLKQLNFRVEVTRETVTEENLPALLDGWTKRQNAKKELWRAVKYTLFAISAGVIQLVSSSILKLVLDAAIVEKIPFFFIIEQDVSTFVADTVGLALSIIWNFTFNRKFTFKAASNVPIAMLLAFLFYVPFYPFQIWYIPMVENGLNIGFWGWLIGLVTCMLINFVLEFLWQQFVVFRGKLDTNAAAQKQNVSVQKTTVQIEVTSSETTEQTESSDETEQVSDK